LILDAELVARFELENGGIIVLWCMAFAGGALKEERHWGRQSTDRNGNILLNH